ncbi:PspA-associated protein PspAB [Streptosporangium sp. DT93]|uniref:PspA-associated protein PspAB n=1 Tax=Streptosporangium sp. DT93 TaxID=3393428 RepID=UPI003CF47C37
MGRTRWWDRLLGRSEVARPDLDALFALPSAAVTLRAATGLAPTGLGAVCFRAAEGAAFAELERDVTGLLDAGGGPPVRVSTDSFGYTWLLVRRTGGSSGDPLDAPSGVLPGDGSRRPAAGSPADPSEAPPGDRSEVPAGDPFDGSPGDPLSDLVTDLHAVNSSLEAAGFGPSLLCSLVSFAAPGPAASDPAVFNPAAPAPAAPVPAAPDGRRLALVYLYKQGTFYPFAPLPDRAAGTGTAAGTGAGGPGRRRDNALELQVRAALGGELRIEQDLGRWFPLWDAPGL